jgi:hypothetical protein
MPAFPLLFQFSQYQSKSLHFTQHGERAIVGSAATENAAALTRADDPADALPLVA